jgi:hypothetical protein
MAIQFQHEFLSIAEAFASLEKLNGSRGLEVEGGLVGQGTAILI